ncbi:MAG TPA: MOSC domain-containing protein [Bryobacteraceae bacterium]|nr:MOSC domain-containing protein [Bryobacteraceae bacterium]
MTGSILQINISAGGIPKRPVPEGWLTPLGFEGDSCNHPEHHGGPQQAVLLIASEVIEELSGKGFPLFFGALGENLTTLGLDRRQWRIGQRFRAGDTLLELTKVRVPCATLNLYGTSIQQEIYDRQVQAGDISSPRWGMSGFYARVLRPGFVRVNDIISLESVLA